MSLKIVVLAKQVPDTRNVGKDAMKADGTINRAALPAIFNPEDLNALEQALRLKDEHPGSTVTILTMGPGRAAEVIREGLYRGADNGYLLTDRAFAGADTLATSYALATAIKKIGDYDVIIGGRQAIDGYTAQVGPQVAEKLGLTQVTYAEEILIVDKAAKKITVKRHIDGGVETVEAPLPIVITVNGSAAPCRPRNAKLVQKYKRALGAQEKAAITKEGAELAYAGLYEKYPYLNITEWSVADVNGDGKINEDDRVVYQKDPDATFSLSTNLRWKGFDFFMDWYAVAGGYILNPLMYDGEYGGDLRGRSNGMKVDYWTPYNPSNTAPRPKYGSEVPYMRTLAYQDASYLRLRTIQLGYTLPKKVTSKLKIQNLRFYMTATNLLTFTKVLSYSPEVTGNLYPETQQTVFGVNFSF